MDVFFSLSTFKMFHCFWWEKSVIILIVVPINVMIFLPLILRFSTYLRFSAVWLYCTWVSFLFVFIPLVFVVLLKCVSRSASSFWKIWDYQLFKYFSFSSLLVFVTLITLMLTELILFHRSLILLLFLIYFFSVLQLDR